VALVLGKTALKRILDRLVRRVEVRWYCGVFINDLTPTPSTDCKDVIPAPWFLRPMVEAFNVFHEWKPDPRGFLSMRGFTCEYFAGEGAIPPGALVYGYYLADSEGLWVGAEREPDAPHPLPPGPGLVYSVTPFLVLQQ